MMRLIALLLLMATPAFAADEPVTILRGASAPPTPWYEPPAPPPQPVVIYQPVVYPQYFYGLPTGERYGSTATTRAGHCSAADLFRREAERHDPGNQDLLQHLVIRHHLLIASAVSR
jgi:hypothetical protein